MRGRSVNSAPWCLIVVLMLHLFPGNCEPPVFVHPREASLITISELYSGVSKGLQQWQQQFDLG